VKQAETLQPLYRLGGLAPLVTLTFYLSQFIFIRWSEYPASTQDWFALFQRSKLLGLFYMNALDIISITLLGVMFLALSSALKPANPSWMTIAAYFGLLGVGVFVVPRVAMLSMLPLAEHYAAITDEIARTRLLTAGETLGALGTPTPQTIGFLFMAVAVLVISIVMLRESRLFNRIVPWLGILAGLFTFANHLSLLFLPSLATPLMIASGLFWMPWWMLVGLGLLRLARSNHPPNAVSRSEK
jgi:hypothetical protein